MANNYTKSEAENKSFTPAVAPRRLEPFGPVPEKAIHVLGVLCWVHVLHVLHNNAVQLLRRLMYNRCTMVRPRANLDHS